VNFNDIQSMNELFTVEWETKKLEYSYLEEHSHLLQLSLLITVAKENGSILSEVSEENFSLIKISPRQKSSVQVKAFNGSFFSSQFINP
jgi:hypothetical protein